MKKNFSFNYFIDPFEGKKKGQKILINPAFNLFLLITATERKRNLFF